MQSELCDEEWKIVKSLLPQDFEELARTHKALTRARGVKNAETLIRLLFLHISGGLSLEQTAFRASELGLAQISAVALFKRLRCSRTWLEVLCSRMMSKHSDKCQIQWPLPGRSFRVFDGSDIREPGATGSSWRLHYSLKMPDLLCDFDQFTPHTKGERLQNYPVKPGEIILADRAYGKRAQIAWLIDAKADAVIRLHPPAFPVDECSDQDAEEQTDLSVNWLEKLDTLPLIGSGEWRVQFMHNKIYYNVRICAIRKSRTAAEIARHKILVEAKKKNRKVQEKTLKMADYVVILTTLPAEVMTTDGVLDLYRCRWQVELAFKRLKSLLEMSSVPKTDEISARAWMQGKLLESLLIEQLLEKTRAFSPWGYTL